MKRQIDKKSVTLNEVTLIFSAEILHFREALLSVRNHVQYNWSKNCKDKEEQSSKDKEIALRIRNVMDCQKKNGNQCENVM